MFIKNVWYIAAHSHELVPGGVLGRTIAGERLAMCRRKDNSIFVLEDRCLHRLAPLSMGELIEGNLRCPYHGAAFDGGGKCVNVPGQETLPDRRVRSFPVKETYGYVWVWTGDPAQCADERSIPEFLKFGLPPYESRSGVIPVQADYRLLVDNLLDPTHAEFIHRTSFGSSDWRAARKAEDKSNQPTEEFTLDMRDDGIDFVYRLGGVTGGPCFGKAYAMRQGKEKWDGLLDIRMDVEWTPPGLFLYGTYSKAHGAGEDDWLPLINLHLLTPETEFTAHYFYRCSVANTLGHPGLADFWHDVDSRAFREDTRIIEAQQKSAGQRDLYDHDLLHFNGDGMSNKGRQILKEMAERERAAGSPWPG